MRIEPKANGKSVVHQLRDSTDLNVTETPTPTDDKAMRLNTCSPKNRMWACGACRGAWNEDFIEEVCKFPTMTHDEYVDILYYAVEYFLLKDKTIPKGMSKASFAGIL